MRFAVYIAASFGTGVDNNVIESDVVKGDVVQR